MSDPVNGGKNQWDPAAEAEHNYRTIIELLPDAAVVHREGIILYANQTSASLAGVQNTSELIDQNIASFMSEGSREEVFKRIKETLDGTRKPVPQESEVVDVYGNRIPVEAVSNVVMYQGSPAVITIIRDISERKATQERLEVSGKILRRVLDSLPVLIYVADMETHELLFINEYGKREFGEVIGHTCYRALQNRESPCEFCTNDKLVDEHGQPTGVYEWEFKNTVNKRWFSIRDMATTWIDGRIVRLEIAMDITDKKQIEQELEEAGVRLKELNAELEERNVDLAEKVQTEIDKQRKQEYLLIQQSKLAAMGEMIGAISHQWRQPLNGLGLIIQDIFDTYDYGELNKEYLEESTKDALELINYMSTTIDDFRDFLTPGGVDDDFYPCQETQNVLSLLHSQLENHGVTVEVECEDYQELIKGSPGEFKQVLMNLINNARDAIERGRAMPSSQQNGEQGLVFIRHKRAGHEHIVEVEDRGTGIDRSIIDRIFEPYFTTKETGQGTGIGLYMSKIIVENRLKGQLNVQNTDRGALFEVRLPSS